MNPQFRQRRYFPFPKWDVLTPEEKAAVWEAEMAWREAKHQEFRAASNAPELLFPHPVARASRALHPGRVHNAIEDDALPAFSLRLRTVLDGSDAAAFIALLEDMATHLVGARQTFRLIPVATDADREGTRILFPRSGTLHGRMTRLYRYLCAAEGPALFLAAVALVAITNAHPFVDGNGRTGRLLFNLVINRDQGEGPLAAVRLHDLGNRPPGNLTLHMRAAELHQDWASLMRLLSAAIAAGGMPVWHTNADHKA